MPGLLCLISLSCALGGRSWEKHQGAALLPGSGDLSLDVSFASALLIASGGGSTRLRLGDTHFLHYSNGRNRVLQGTSGAGQGIGLL